MVTLKITFREDTRRVSMDSSMSFESLQEMLYQLFPQDKNALIIKYLDDDKDLITISSDLELSEAIKFARSQPNQVLRITLSLRLDPSNESTSSNVPSNSNLNSNPEGLPFMDLLNNPSAISNMLSQLLGTNVPKDDLENLMKNLGLQGDANANGNANANANANQIPQLGQLFGLLQNPAISMFLNQFKDIAKEANEPHFWYNVTCDSCGEHIKGMRYKCSECDNFDLCSSCKASPNVHDPKHAFVSMDKPSQAPHQPMRHEHGHHGHHGHGHRGFHGHGRHGQHENGDAPHGHKGHGHGHRGVLGCKKDNPQKFFARYVADLTIPDGTPIAQDQSFVKIWKMRNEGATTWPADTHLVFVGGDKLSAVESISLNGEIESSKEVDLSIDMKAPSKTGRYISYWRLSTGDGNRFGQRVWVDITVVVAETEKQPQTISTQTMEVTATENTSLSVDPTPTLTPTQNENSFISFNPVDTVMIPSAPVDTPNNSNPFVVSYPIIDQSAQTVQNIQTHPVPLVPVRLAPKVKQLMEMGFGTDPVLIQAVLDRNHEDMIPTIQDLLALNQ